MRKKHILNRRGLRQRARSLVRLERLAHNQVAAGSNPAGPIFETYFDVNKLKVKSINKNEVGMV